MFYVVFSFHLKVEKLSHGSIEIVVCCNAPVQVVIVGIFLDIIQHLQHKNYDLLIFKTAT